jgi:succinoglycan biosynthesis transport protein ExoP
MEKDERLLPLPTASGLQLNNQDTAAGSYSPYYDEDGFKESRSIREYFLVVYKRLPLILALTILATAATAFYMYRQASIYEATTTMIIEPPKPKIQSGSTFNINFGNDVNYYNTQLRLLQNPDLMREVVIRLGLHRDPNLFSQQNKGVISSLRSMLSGDKSQNKESSLPVLTETSGDSASSSSSIDTLTPEEKLRAEAYAGMLLGQLSVEQTLATNLVNVKLTTTNPEIAPKVTDMVAAVFIEQDKDRAMQGQKDTYTDLTKSIEELRVDIAQKEQERLMQMKNSGLPLAEKGGDLASQRLQQMSTQWLTAEDNKIE